MTVPPLRGRIDVFDPATRVGVICGVDGARYRFGGEDFPASAQLAMGQHVAFLAGNAGRARQVEPVESPAGAFDFGRVVRRMFGSLGRHWRLSFGAAVVLVGIPGAVSAWGRLYMAGEMQIPGLLAYWLGAMARQIGMFLLVGALAQAMIGDFRGGGTSLRQSLDALAATALPLAGLAVLGTLGVLVGALFFVIPALVLSVWWSVAGPVMVIERLGITQSLGRSTDLTEGYRWRLFGAFVAYTVISWLFAQGVGALVAGLHNTQLQTALYVVGSTAHGVITRLINVVAAIAIYYELRTVKEGDEPDALAAVFD